jgi:hypothetical protein
MIRHTAKKRLGSGCTVVDQGKLVVQCPIIIDDADQSQPTGKKIEDSAEPFAHVKTMDAENTQKRKKRPGHIVVKGSDRKPQIGIPVHSGYKKKVNDPTDEEQTQRKEVKSATDGLAVIEAMGPHESEDPQDISNGLAMGVFPG